MGADTASQVKYIINCYVNIQIINLKKILDKSTSI